MAVFNEPIQWEHTLGNNADTSTLPDDAAATAGIASLQKLFQIINATPLEAGGIAPDREDVNALFKYLGDQIFYTQNGGVPSYNPAYDYIPGRVILYTDNKLYKCIQANGASSTVVAPDSVTPLGSDYWKDIENQDNSSLIPNQLIVSPVPLTDANLHLLDGALLSGSGAYADYVAMMGELYNADPTATCWTTESDWQTSVTTYGECGKFVFDSVNNTLRLPKLKSFIQATTTESELGLLVEAGLPNITGRLAYNSTGGIGDLTGSSGCIKGTSGANTYLSATTGNAVFMDIDASRSNPIYGNSNTVQPQAIKYYFYIVVGTVSKTDIQIDIDNVLTDLNGKADKDLSNVTAPTQAFKDMVVGWSTPDYKSGIRVGPLSQGQAWKAPANGILISVVKAPSGGVFLSHTKANDVIDTNNVADNWVIYNDTFSGGDDYQTATAIVGKGETLYQANAVVDYSYGIIMFYPFK